MLVKAVHVPAVEEDFLLHPRVEERLEHGEHHVEHPGLVEDVYRVSLHRERRHHEGYHHVGNLSTRVNGGKLVKNVPFSLLSFRIDSSSRFFDLAYSLRSSREEEREERWGLIFSFLLRYRSRLTVKRGSNSTE